MLVEIGGDRRIAGDRALAIGVVGDDGLRSALFRLRRFWGDIDLMGFQCFLLGSHRQEPIELPIEQAGEFVHAHWTIRAPDTAQAGERLIQLKFIDSARGMVFQTRVGRAALERALDTEED